MTFNRESFYFLSLIGALASSVLMAQGLPSVESETVGLSSDRFSIPAGHF
jgi:hypothetical protein